MNTKSIKISKYEDNGSISEYKYNFKDNQENRKVIIDFYLGKDLAFDFFETDRDKFIKSEIDEIKEGEDKIEIIDYDENLEELNIDIIKNYI